MIIRIHASVALALTLSSATAFSRSSIAPKPAFSISTSPLHAFAINSEDDALWLLRKAEECANSDSCSIDDARSYLRDVVTIQSGCVTGTLAGGEVCDDVGYAAEVVAGLREKIKKSSVGSYALSAGGSLSILEPASNPLDVPLQAALIILASVYVASILATNPGVSNVPFMGEYAVPFTAQEWWWALRDGYLGDMAREYGQHGGLMQMMTTSTPGAMSEAGASVPFTPQEWWWAFRDGYVSDMASEYLRHGGLMQLASSSASMSDANAVVSFTAQEWFWAARDGYLPDVFGEVAKNGGFMVCGADAIDQASEVVPMTGHEWTVAAKDGYIGDAVKHIYRNGGF